MPILAHHKKPFTNTVLYPNYALCHESHIQCIFDGSYTSLTNLIHRCFWTWIKTKHASSVVRWGSHTLSSFERGNTHGRAQWNTNYNSSRNSVNKRFLNLYRLKKKKNQTNIGIFNRRFWIYSTFHVVGKLYRRSNADALEDANSTGFLDDLAKHKKLSKNILLKVHFVHLSWRVPWKLYPVYFWGIIGQLGTWLFWIERKRVFFCRSAR